MAAIKSFLAGDSKAALDSLTNASSLVSLGVGAGLGYLLGGGIGALLGIAGGAVLSEMLDQSLFPHTGPEALTPRPGTSIIPEDVIRARDHKVALPAKTETVRVAEILLEKLKVPTKDIAMMDKARKDAETAALRYFRGELSTTDLRAFEQARVDLLAKDKELGQYLANFHKYDTTRKESKELVADRTKLVRTLKNAGMSQADIDNVIPDLPSLPDGARFAALDEANYAKGLALYAAKKGKTTAQVKTEWDKMDSFAQLNDLRNQYTDEMHENWKAIASAKDKMYGTHYYVTEGSRRLNAKDTKTWTATVNTGDMTGTDCFGLRQSNDGAQCYCAKAIADLIQRNPADPAPTKEIKTNRGIINDDYWKTLDRYDIPRGGEGYAVDGTKVFVHEGRPWTNNQHMARVAAVGLQYAKGNSDDEACTAYKKVLLYCQATERRAALDGVASQMNKTLKTLNEWREGELETIKRKIAAFQSQYLPKLNKVLKARGKQGFAITRKAVDGTNAVLVVDDTSAGRKRRLMFVGTVDDQGKFTAKQYSESAVPIDDDDKKMVANALASTTLQGVPSEMVVDVNSLEGVAQMKTLLDVTRGGSGRKPPEPQVKKPEKKNADKDPTKGVKPPEGPPKAKKPCVVRTYQVNGDEHVERCPEADALPDLHLCFKQQGNGSHKLTKWKRHGQKWQQPATEVTLTAEQFRQLSDPSAAREEIFDAVMKGAEKVTISFMQRSDDGGELGRFAPPRTGPEAAPSLSVVQPKGPRSC